MEIPFNKPLFTGKELDYMAEAVRFGHASGDGPFTKRCQLLLEETLGIKKALLTTSCTHALEITALLLDLKPGDEVVVPAYTFVSTINAFVLRGAIPRFVDVRADTLNFDERQLEASLNDKTKAVVVVHYAGVSCEMESILKLAEKRNIPVVEDNAHGLFAAYRGRALGTLGTFGTLSFHETKNFSCGEGGALLLNDQKLIDRAEIFREKGTNRKKFLSGQVDKYTWVDVGSSYLPSDLLAAFLFAQLESRSLIEKQRARIWHGYAEKLQGWAESLGIQLPQVPDSCTQSYHMFYLILPNKRMRDDLISFLGSRNILAVFHYQPLNQSDMAHRLGAAVSCPVAERLGECLLRLPFYSGMNEEEQAYVVQNILQFKGAAT
jgi:dTDP-4-amino-4,6-dideoxygalactose transaminase